MDQTKLTTVCVTAETALTLLNLKDIAKVKNFISFDKLSIELLQKIKDRDINLYYF